MKRLTILAIGMISLCGCARFTTTQEELRYDDKGKIAGRITTRAGSFTFFDSKSALANFRATQSEKTQSAQVGSLNQQAYGTNAVAVLEGVEKILRSSQPTP